MSVHLVHQMCFKQSVQILKETAKNLSTWAAWQCLVSPNPHQAQGSKQSLLSNAHRIQCLAPLSTPPSTETVSSFLCPQEVKYQIETNKSYLFPQIHAGPTCLFGAVFVEKNYQE